MKRFSSKSWWFRDADWEQIRGLGTLLAWVLAAVLTVVVLFWSVPYWIRLWLPLVAWLGVYSAASKNWTRRTLRLTGGISLLLIAVLLVSVGKRHLIASELASVNTTLQALEKQVDHKRFLPSKDVIEKTKTKASYLDLQNVLRPRALAVLEELERVRVYRASGGPPVLVDLTPIEAEYRPEISSSVEKEVKEETTEIRDNLAKSTPDEAPVIAALQPLCSYVDKGAMKNLKCTEGNRDGEGKRVSPDAVSLATLRLRLAAYRADVLGREEDTKAVVVLDEALKTSVASPANPSFAQLLTSGAGALVTSLSLQRSGDKIVPDSALWALLLLAVFGLWRIVERTSARTMSGPVVINAEGLDLPAAQPTKGFGQESSDAASTKHISDADQARTDQNKEAQKRAFKAALLRNLPEPASIPGETTVSSLTDLIELPTPIGKGAGAALTAFKNLFAKQGGYSVTAQVFEPSTPAGNWQVLVRISDQWSGNQISVDAVTGRSPVEACRAAGFLAAANVLSHSRRLPTWSRWDKSTAQGLAANNTDVHPTVPALEAALSKAPSSGLLLTKLGNAYSLEGEHVKALTVYARAVAAHPRFMEANYRMAISSGFVAADPMQWAQMPLSGRMRLTAQIDRAREKLKLELLPEQIHSLNVPEPENFKTILLALAEQVLTRLEQSHLLPQVAAQSLRKSERAVWWPLLTSPSAFGHAAEIRWLVKSAKLTTFFLQESGPGLDGQGNIPPDYAQVVRRAVDPRSSAAVSYNLACYHARRGEPTEACGWLERSLQQPESARMGEWLEKDPDLKSLHGNPRFEWIRRHLGAKAAR